MFSFTRIPFWVHMFDPQPNQQSRLADVDTLACEAKGRMAACKALEQLGEACAAAPRAVPRLARLLHDSERSFRLRGRDVNFGSPYPLKEPLGSSPRHPRTTKVPTSLQVHGGKEP